ncbi:MAG: glycoside hydrolase family 3 N-terminal domain-containing protein, partial [Anaerolineales bacterium]
LLLAFHGKDQLSPEFQEAIHELRPGGVTLFRSLNVDDPKQVKRLTDLIQKTAKQAGLPFMLIAVDQEGGQLMAIGENATPLPGNMALGATNSEELAERAGKVLGTELAAMGININYSPSCDVNINPKNPVVGIRSFGESPEMVARLASAMIKGIQSAGVAATAKHFPGHGDTDTDSHIGLPRVSHSLERLQSVELPPFKSAINAGVKLVMTAHMALPVIDGLPALPATLSRKVLTNMLRDELGFPGVTITDAMDMKAIPQGEALGENAARAISAGADLLLLTSEPLDQKRVHASLLRAATEKRFDPNEMNASLERIASLKKWLEEFSLTKPDISVMGCEEHRRFADELAERSITLVRDHNKLLPLHLTDQQKIVVVNPQPIDLTPADTSSYVIPTLATGLRRYHSKVDEFIVPHSPSEREIAEVLEKIRQYDLVIAGTINAFNNPPQISLVREILKIKIPTITVAMRLPYDLTSFEETPTFICTYSILPPSMQALAKAMFGQIQFRGHLPVSIPGLYPAGYGLLNRS